MTGKLALRVAALGYLAALVAVPVVLVFWARSSPARTSRGLP